jgi:uncharacterized SAM-binding protein YcdF (DUF218 family)
MYDLLASLTQPFVLFTVLMSIGLVLIWRRCPECRRILALVVAVFVLFTATCTPAFSHLFVGSLERRYPSVKPAQKQEQAIVVLSCWVHPAKGLRREPELGPDTLYRCLRASELYLRGEPRPIIVSGGQVKADEDLTFAEAMKTFLVGQGVAPQDVLVEDRSTTTYENAVETAKILKRLKIDTVVLVVDAVDMLRAERCFQAQGIAVLPSPTNYRTSEFEWSPGSFLPEPDSTAHTQRAAHERLGLIWYWLNDRV